MKRSSLAWLALLLTPLLASAKGETTRITLQQDGRTLAVLGSTATRQFRFGKDAGSIVLVPDTKAQPIKADPNWGPTGRVPARPRVPMKAVPTSTGTPWIVEDWTSPVAEPSQELPRIQAAFHVENAEDKGRDYVVHYAYDSATHQGYVYLPGKGEPYHEQNSQLLWRGDAADGQWFRATDDWTQTVQAAIGLKQ